MSKSTLAHTGTNPDKGHFQIRGTSSWENNFIAWEVAPSEHLWHTKISHPPKGTPVPAAHESPGARSVRRCKGPDESVRIGLFHGRQRVSSLLSRPAFLVLVPPPSTRNPTGGKMKS